MQTILPSKNVFRKQIQEDIKTVQENCAWDANITKDEYAFNYWVLTNLYSVDENLCHSFITEYSDKGIDCYVHYEDDKELYLIQNKYYGDATRLSSQDVSDFLTRPIATLKGGKYKKPELQKIFNAAQKDSDYKIFLHFYVTSDQKSGDVDNILASTQLDEGIYAEVFYLDDIYDKYYGKQYKENPKLDFSFETLNKGTYLAIRPEEYNLPNMSEAYYAMTKVSDIYRLWKKADDENYPLFAENIRDYLGGGSGINKAIIDTLKSKEDRSNFFYYNNGVTIICDQAKTVSGKINVTKPQIVNGCQTVNSIAAAIHHTESLVDDYNDTYVMTKILVVDENDENTHGDNESLHRKIVRYTNSQNAINEKTFGATLAPFFKIQEGIKNVGFLVTVKQSDNHTFNETYKDKRQKSELIARAQRQTLPEFYKFEKLTDVKITLETLIQIIGAFEIDAQFAYVKKSELLKPTSGTYKDFSIKINDKYTVGCMAKLIALYKKSEHDKKRSDDKRTPQPYYLLNFLGAYLKKRGIDKREFLERQLTSENISVVYNGFKNLPGKYYDAVKEKYNLEYNQMLKRTVDSDIVASETAKHFDALNEHNPARYEELMAIFNL